MSNVKKKKISGTENKKSIDKMKYEIANEFGINLGPDATSKENGTVGGEITKRLVKMGQVKSSYSKK